MKTVFVILYIAGSGIHTSPQKVGWFETMPSCVAAKSHAEENQDGVQFVFSCVEYLDNMDGLFK